MKTAQKIVNNLINETIFPLKLIKARWMIFVDNQFMSKHTFHIQNPSIHLFQLDFLLVHMLNGNEICLNKQTIQCSKILDIAYAPSFWTILVSWYPHCGITTIHHTHVSFNC